MSELLWVTVPGGAVPADGRPVLRAVVVPRLFGAEPGVLSSYGLQDWPAALAAATLTVEVAPEMNTPATPVESTRRDHVQPDVWPRFFAADMPVRPWQQRTQPAPSVEPTATHAGNIARTYTEAARAISQPRDGVDPAEVIRQQYAIWGNNAGTAEVTSGRPAPWELPDFHRAVSFLREHPSVLQALGLIVELTLAPGQLPPSSPAAPQLVRVRCTPGAGLPAELRMVSPWTKYEFGGNRFLPAADPGGDLTGGMIDLAGSAATVPSPPPGGRLSAASRSRWEIATFDVDGGVGRLRDAATAGGSTAEGPGHAALPTLRSAGLMLIRRGRIEVFRARTHAASTNAAATSPDQLVLGAEDLVLGYRVDVREFGSDDSNDDWFSLCRRKAHYVVDDLAIGAAGLDEEGHLKAHAASAVGSGRVLRADEVVARWSGWSLAVPRPMFDEGGVRARPQGRLPMPFDFDFNFELDEGWLPKLRFGSAYLLRVRIADMAGGGLGPADPASNQHASEVVSYRRHEPVPPPEVPPPDGLLVTDAQGTRPDPHALGPGGSLEQLVIRSDPAANLTVEQFAGQHPEYPVNDRRALVPPLASMALAEQHGKFDGVPAAASWEWVQRSTRPPVATADGSYSWLPDPASFGVVIRVRPDPGSPAPDARIDDGWGQGWPDLQAKSLQVGPGTPDAPTITWDDGGRAVVSLRPAEQVTLELSSHLKPDDVDNMEIRRWLGDVPDTTVLAGLHPMVTPARVLHLVHAVRRPLTEPSGKLVAKRAAGETFAVIDDPSDQRIGVDVASTVQVDVAASWDEWRDGDPTPTAQQVLSARVDRGAARLPELRHEFGDTRHRRVRYTLTAVSRFSQFFDPGPADDFQRQATLDEVVVPSSARPAPPVVVSTNPSFRWVGLEVPPTWDSLQRSRLGGRLRVELARPWYTTGQGELLAVVVSPSGQEGGLPGSVARHVSLVHRDPIWATSSPVGAVEASMFTGFAATPQSVSLSENGATVGVVPYAVWREGDRWYADVELPAATLGSYCPFVRLAVARYQPHSVAGLELSTVVQTEPVQLFPDRTLTVVRTAGGLELVLAGTGPVGPLPNRVVAALERCLPPPGVPAGAVELTAEAADGSLAWRRVPEHHVEGGLNSPLPLPLPAGDGALRVVVREVEQIPADAVEAGGVLAAELGQRTVFTDVIPVSVTR